MKTSLHEHDPMGWSFETFRTPRFWAAVPDPPGAVHKLTETPLFRGTIIGTGALVVALLIAQGIPSGHAPNVIAAWLAGGGLVYATLAIDSPARRGYGLLALSGLIAVVLAGLGLAAPGWLIVATLVHTIAGTAAARLTRFAGFFTAWASFHALLGLLLLI